MSLPNWSIRHQINRLARASKTATIRSIQTIDSQTGLSLVELMIAVAVVGIVGSAMMSLMTTLNQQQLTNQIKYSRLSSSLFIQQDLADENACLLTLGGLDPSKTPSIKLIKTSTGAELLNLSQPSTRSGELIDLQLSPLASAPADFAVLTLNFSKAPGTIAFQPTQVRLSIVKDSSNKIIRCSSFVLASAKIALANIGCSGTRVLQGFDASGNAICITPVSAPAPVITAPVASGTPPSSCGGSQGYGAVVNTISDPDGKATYLGLSCGMSNGTAKLCYSCSAQWFYPRGPGTGNPIQCVCH